MIETVKSSLFFDPIKASETNVDIQSIDWIRQFLYPYNLDPNPLKATDFPVHGMTAAQIALEEPCMQKPKLGEKIDVLETDKFKFPLTHLSRKEEHLNDILKAISISQAKILNQLHIYEKEFPYRLIPFVHADKLRINDIIHHYKRPPIKEPTNQGFVIEPTSPGSGKLDEKSSTRTKKQSKLDGKQVSKAKQGDSPKNEPQQDFLKPVKEKKNLAFIQGKPKLSEADIDLTKNELTRESTAKLIGLVAHLAYWRVFGHFNDLCLDKYH